MRTAEPDGPRAIFLPRSAPTVAMPSPWRTTMCTSSGYRLPSARNPENGPWLSNGPLPS
ncbi:Uncharacterised protein [Bordetella pertussis]|nr:Uncharacterised protein [Bordetella pertussis]